MYVANSEPAIWPRGAGRADVTRQVPISGEANRGEAATGYGEEVCLTRGSPPDLAAKEFPNAAIKPERIGRTPKRDGTEGGRFADSTEDSGPMKPGNRAEEKTLTTGNIRAAQKRYWTVESRRRKATRTTSLSRTEGECRQ